MTEDMTIIAEEAYLAAKEILEKAKLEQGELFVVGCSTSEVGGATIGTYSSPELAEMVFGGIYQATQEAGVYLAAQCCEHLNRAVIVEKELMKRDHLGDTLIGMHLRDVAVPVRLRSGQIGDAHVVCARTRPKFIGGGRAVYDEELL